MNATLNPITALREFRAKSRRTNVRKKPLVGVPRPRKDKSVNPFTAAGKLLYGFYEAAAARRDVALQRAIRNESRPQGRHGARERARRLRQQAHLHQHPSVVERFAGYPSVSEVQALIAEVEGAATPLDPYRKIDGETKRERDARIKREKKALAV